MSTLERAIAIACEAHKGQVDKGGQPYILHCLRVMMQMRTEEERIVAVLHDVLEDNEWAFGEIVHNSFSITILDALNSISRKANESYNDYIGRVSKNELARVVKIADLHDNMDIDRLPKPLTDRDWKRLEKYGRAINQLEEGR